MISLAGLNDHQRQAAEAIDGPVLILAGAGSGKTRTITYRMAHMIDNLHISPREILAISFTNKAGREMKERMAALLSKQKQRGITLATFHSLGLRILKKEIEHLGYHLNFSIYDTADQLSIIREAMKALRAEKSFDKKQILSKIGFLKNHTISADEFADSPYFNGDDPYDHATLYAYQYYEDKLKFYNAIDFDDILILTVRLFRENPEIKNKYSQQYKYVMIDEYQDTNSLQFDLVLALTSTHNNICVVGDDDQAIYSFRGADISNILNFEKNFPGAKIVKLEENYRSTMPILSLANRVIRENKGRRKKTLWSQTQSSHLPILWAMGDSDHEAQVLCDEIVRHQSSGGHLGDIAILYRSNTQVAPIEDQLRISQVPYTIIGGQKFYEKKEIKDLMAYLSTILNPSDQIALRRILNVPSRGIGNVTLEKFLDKSRADNICLFSALENFPDLAGGRSEAVVKFTKTIRHFQQKFVEHPLPQATSALIEDIHFLEHVAKCYDNPKQIERKKNDVHHFLESCERFTKFFGKQATLKNFIARLLLQDSQDNTDLDEEDSDIRKNEVTLMTLHSSKGLEFDIVYLMGMEEETLPHKKSIVQGDISEERRLCYVGITRARKKLFMTYCKERKFYGKDLARHRSRFVNELEKEGLLIEQDRTSFGHLNEQEIKEYKKNFFDDLMGLLD